MDSNFSKELSRSYGDPSFFATLVFGGTPGLHAGQVKYAENATADTNFLLPGNSWGKTEFILRFACYLCWHKVGPLRPTHPVEWKEQVYKGLIASFNYPIAKESFDRFEHYMRTREELRVLVQHVTRTDPPRVEFVNGAVLDWGSLSEAGKLVEAARRNFICIDEVGHIPNIKEMFTNIIYPRTMGVEGRVHLFGTPKPDSDPYLFEIYNKGLSGNDPFYYAQEGSVFENEFWTTRERQRVLQNPEYVKGWDKCKGCDDLLEFTVCMPKHGGHPILTPMGRQVFLGKFILAGGLWFRQEYIQRLFSGEFPEVTWRGENHFAEEPKDGRVYMAAFDLGGNKARKRKKPGSDPTVGFVVDYTERPWRIVRYDFIEGGDLDWEQKYELMADIYRRYKLPYLMIDATGQIDSVQEALETRGVAVEPVQFGGQGNKKFDMLRNLQLVTEMRWSETRGLLRSPLIEGLKYELEHYVMPDDNIQQDRVMALGMVAWHVSQIELPPASGDILF